MNRVDHFLSPEKRAAYLATTYVVDEPPVVRIRIGQPVPELETEWAFVTAANPGSAATLPDALNERRNAALEREVAARWAYRHGRGVPDQGAWPPEHSLLVLGISREDAVDLGRRHGQNAVVVGRPGEPAALAECFPEN